MIKYNLHINEFLSYSKINVIPNNTNNKDITSVTMSINIIINSLTLYTFLIKRKVKFKKPWS